MSLPYSSATSGERALGDIQKILRGFGCNKFGSMIDDGEGIVLVQFQYHGREATVKASIKGYAAAWLRENKRGPRTQATEAEHNAKAMQIASVAVYSILRDWIKGQVTAIETGILTFEGAFLGNLMLGNGQTVMEHIEKQKLLPAMIDNTPRIG
ncbi:hypothetical protein VLK31_06965 [Variovorax sp. H27-G14]|uniref:hypothetical protein n=1 Tax=Variovorax sp. H27-G14 TaxID=3111914 RepID=UPI0038FD09BE